MKISKLFHWLYALVMFLPILIFIPNVFYFAFNEHAQLSNSEPIVNVDTTLEYEYQFYTDDVSSYNDLYIGPIYYCSDSISVLAEDITAEFSISVYKANEFYAYDKYFVESLSEGRVNYLRSELVFYFQPDQIDVVQYNDEFYVDLTCSSFELSDFYFTIGYSLSDFIDFADAFSLTITSSDWLGGIVSADASSTYTIDYEYTTITGAVSNGWNQVWDLPIFSWSHNTFFSAPFNYISALFGFQAGNSISYCLSYWFSISIIWLVFDLMLYVPLLVHRWLDKASIS